VSYFSRMVLGIFGLLLLLGALVVLVNIDIRLRAILALMLQTGERDRARALREEKSEDRAILHSRSDDDF
jgi:hypothetical protein